MTDAERQELIRGQIDWWEGEEGRLRKQAEGAARKKDYARAADLVVMAEVLRCVVLDAKRALLGRRG